MEKLNSGITLLVACMSLTGVIEVGNDHVDESE